MYQKKGQLKKGAMWETQCHINLASIPPIKILMGMILGMVCGIEFTGFTTIGDFQKPWLKQQNLSRDKPLGSLWYTQND